MTWAELNEVRDLRKIIYDMQSEIDALRRSLALKVPIRDGMPKGTPMDSRTERIVVRIADAETQLEEYKRRVDEEAIPRVEQKIYETIPSGTSRLLFIFRYVDCMCFRDIGSAMGYSEGHVYYLHRITGERFVSDWR